MVPASETFSSADSRRIAQRLLFQGDLGRSSFSETTRNWNGTLLRPTPACLDVAVDGFQRQADVIVHLRQVLRIGRLQGRQILVDDETILRVELMLAIISRAGGGFSSAAGKLFGGRRFIFPVLHLFGEGDERDRPFIRQAGQIEREIVAHAGHQGPAESGSGWLGARYARPTAARPSLRGLLFRCQEDRRLAFGDAARQLDLDGFDS